MTRLLVATLLFFAVSCAAELARESNTVCRPVSWQACQAECGRGIQQCTDAGDEWSECQCVVYEASFDAAPVDAATDASAEGD